MRIWNACLITATVLASAMSVRSDRLSERHGQLPLQYESSSASERVNVAIGVMSRCPDALFFENAFSKALERINEKINLSLNYIATQNDSASFGATCKHGDEECEGNIHQLCVIDALDPRKAGRRYDLGPSAAQRLWWEFVQCQNYVGGTKRIGQESLAKECLKAVGGVPDWETDGIKKCVQGKRGRQLLKENIEETRAQGIRNSATLLIEGRIVCIRDDSQWKNCSAGHETYDWVRQVEDAYRRKNPSMGVLRETSSVTGYLMKRQQSPSASNTFLPPPPTGSPNNNGNTQQGAPLSVFALTKGLPERLDLSIIHAAQIHHMMVGGGGSLFLQPRQNGPGGGNSTSNNTNNSPFGGFFPTPYLAFGLTAIALFVLVVSFVLLRIFMRNRRLRRMGIYPEGPIDRFLGGNIREYEDTLAPPRLWEAKIADVYAGKATGEFEEKAGGEGGKEQRGWDALMPISAALPPNLYPVIYDTTEQPSAATEGSTTYPPNQHANRIGLHMPQFLRRHTGEGVDAAAPNDSTPVSGGALPANTAAAAESASAIASTNGDRGEDRLAASVNITVLIAMPSPRTVLPSRQASSAVSSSFTQGRNVTGGAQSGSKLQEVTEDNDGDVDVLSLKGKAKRAASLRSVRSNASLKSVAEARREAFFSQGEKEGPVMQPATVSSPAPAYDDDEDEELPELMFGTASVPIFARTGATKTVNSHADTLSRQQSLSSRLSQPSRSDIMALIAAAQRAREKKAEAETAAAEKIKKQEEVEAEANRRSVAETSLDGEGTSAIGTTGVSHDRSIDDGPHAPLGDVATRMMRANNVSEEYEMGSMRSMQSHPLSQTSVQPGVSSASATQQTGEGAVTPTTSMPLTYTESRGYSMTSFHTGTEGDGDNTGRSHAGHQ